jgi:hypothetical protein
VGVVQVFWAVHAQADQEAVLAEEPAPRVVQEEAVGLEGVLDPGAGPGARELVPDRAVEEIEAGQGRLAALPGDGDRGGAVGREELLDIRPGDPIYARLTSSGMTGALSG